MTENRETSRDPMAAAVESELRGGTFLTELANRLAGVVRDARNLATERQLRDDPCRRAAPTGEMAGRPCPACGHVNLLHPGVNPDLEACLVCQVDGLRRELTVVVGDRVTASESREAAPPAGGPSVDELLDLLRREIASRPNPGNGYTPDAAVTGLRLAVTLLATARLAWADGHR